MSENMTIALISTLSVLLQVLIAFIVSRCFSSIDKLNEKVDSFVKESSCDSLMCKHYQEIQNLWKNTRENSGKITLLEARINAKNE